MVAGYRVAGVLTETLGFRVQGLGFTGLGSAGLTNADPAL